ncbi:MAG: metallopeptidase family protein [Candidatus Aminicenantales bacterium]
MDRDKFEALIEEALASVPKKFQKLLQNLAVIIEDKSSGEMRRRKDVPLSGSILGLYHGVPFRHRGPYYGNIPPDVIVIYQKPIESICASEEEIKEKVKEVVLHEIGHYFGLSERELRDLER